MTKPSGKKYYLCLVFVRGVRPRAPREYRADEGFFCPQTLKKKNLFNIV